MHASWKKIVAAALAVGTLAGAPLAVQADVNFFLSNPASGGAFPSTSGVTCGVNGSCVNYSANLGDVFIWPAFRRRLTLSTTPAIAGSFVSTSITLPCTGGFVGASSPGFVLSSGTLDNLSATCPIGQTGQTGWGIVDAF